MTFLAVCEPFCVQLLTLQTVQLLKYLFAKSYSSYIALPSAMLEAWVILFLKLLAFVLLPPKRK